MEIIYFRGMHSNLCKNKLEFLKIDINFYKNKVRIIFKNMIY